MPELIVCPPLSRAHGGVEHGWALAADDGRTLLSHGSAPLALLPAGNDVTLLVPGAALSWHAVALPPGNLGGAARLRALLDGLLEDRLLDEPESLHFALEPGAKPGATVWIAASHRIELRAAVQALESAGRRVTRIVPEFAPQPADAPAMLFATGEPESAQLTVCDANGVATLPLNTASLTLVGGAPLDTAVASAEPAVAAQAEALLGQRLPIAQTPERWLQAARTSWDLAQFDLASSGRARAGKKVGALWHALRHAPQWRAARWGAVVLVLAQLVGLNAWAWKERNALEAKRSRINAILLQTFPSVKVVLDAPLQMASEVAALQQATGGVAALDLEPMLAVLGASLPPGRVPTALDYSAGQLRLRGLNLSATEVATLMNTITTRGYTARSEGDLLLVQAEVRR
ncbi:type II secretion system protein GspL [Variovorax rhizosphaerae]|uniref:Type II secretion system protein GspL n=1 Tax=Variovorax rhizosphaerae TaxID=1836200 RepID=A0ABU8WI61_9BURK